MDERIRLIRSHYVDEITEKLAGSEVKLAGWVRKKMELGGLTFVMLRDSTGVIQVVFREDRIGKEKMKEARKLSMESSIIVSGRVKLDKRAPNGLEIEADDLRVVGYAEEFPIKPGVGKKFLFDNRHLHIRGRRAQAFLKIRSELIKAFEEWYNSHGFTRVEAPTFVGTAVEGGATLFEVDYFGKKAYLTQSSQFYLEAMIFSFDNVYTIQPSFRAEKSRTKRHLTEFWHLEAEMAWADLNSMMDVVESSLKYAVEKVCERAADQLSMLKRKFEPPSGRFPRITYDEAVEIARRKGVKIEWGDDLGAEAERAVSLEFDLPVFVTHYPKAAKAFYHKIYPEDPRKVVCADLLAPEGIGEIVGGGQRIDDLNELLTRIREENLDPESYRWYIDLRRYGTVPHAGFGLGIERTARWISGADSVRDVVPFPRTPTRINP